MIIVFRLVHKMHGLKEYQFGFEGTNWHCLIICYCELCLPKNGIVSFVLQYYICWNWEEMWSTRFLGVANESPSNHYGCQVGGMEVWHILWLVHLQCFQDVSKFICILHNITYVFYIFTYKFFMCEPFYTLCRCH
jgi:hypothetical protein